MSTLPGREEEREAGQGMDCHIRTGQEGVLQGSHIPSRRFVMKESYSNEA